MTETTHLGRKISRLLELRGMKQETLAEQLGISQQSVSKIEQSENIEEATLEKISKVLGLSKEAIKSFNENSLILYIENMHSQASAGTYHQPVFNFESAEKSTLARDEKIELLNALLKEKDEKIALQQKLIEKLEKK